MIVLGLETSCDETAAALVSDDALPASRILAQRLLSQTSDHAPYGGVVPEIAARSHLDHIDRLVNETMAEAGLGFADIDAVAATGGPGLIGGVIVGVMTGKAIAAARGLPFLAVNHLQGHALSIRLEADLAFPFLLLLVSGGHCQLVLVEDVHHFQRLGTTKDDALGEAFDKVAKMLGLGYPGGPAVERWAERGHPQRFPLPRPLLGRPGCDFSFSGLKTALRQQVTALGPAITDQDIADLCAAFQAAAAAVLSDRCRHAVLRFRGLYPDIESPPLVVAGGVAANRVLRQSLTAFAAEMGWHLYAPAPALCTDNAAMIAWAGLERFRRGEQDGLDFRPRPRWPLEHLTESPA